MIFNPEEYRILIVDDSQENISYIGGLLEGYKRSFALSGQKAIEKANGDEPIDIILLDVTMPEMDGYEVCKILKSNEKTKDIPILFVTGRDEEIDEVRGFELGAADYITKPISPEKFKARVKTHLLLKKTNEKLIIEKEAAEEANMAKTKFLSIISHDLRGPVCCMFDLISLMNEEERFDEEEKRSLMTDLRALAEKTYLFLDNLLEWSAMQLNAVTNIETVKIYDLVKESISLLKEIAKQKQIEINLNVENIEFKVDKRMMATVIRNLVSNAIKFVEKGGKINITAKEFVDKVEIRIRDNGVGIEKKTLEKLLRIDYRVSYRGTLGEKGSGMGLKLCKEFVEKNNGKITIESEVDVGTEVIIELFK